MPSYTISSVSTGQFVSPESQGVGSPVITEGNPTGQVNFSESLQAGIPTTIQNSIGLFMAIGPSQVITWAPGPFYWNLVHSQNGYQVTTLDGAFVWFQDNSTVPRITIFPVPDNQVIPTYFNIY